MTVQVISSADSVRSFLLDPTVSNDPSALDDSSHCGGWQVSKTGRLLTPPEIDELRQVTFSPEAYFFYPQVKLCNPRPGVGFRFFAGREHVDLAICFECLQWFFSGAGKQLGQDFDGKAPELMALAQGVFPDLRLDMREATERKRKMINKKWSYEREGKRRP